ncbi:MAG TPA: hydroxymethylglutaryl-CoA reductase [Verrucomicrobiales bacterium]|nr:hydroxymethylglutaryl-CoA reductase [Verrucomicrobiales bacterium]|tara:strand:+ start:1966 stop:3117 length:1152 start_codon:yes stop_codon:yes gene_type:complete
MNKLTPPRGYTQADTEARQQWLREQTGHQVPDFALDEPENLKGLIENHVGFVGLPQSVAGPLKIDGTYAQGDYYVPLCTVEGTLTLSMTRGFYLTHRSGGIKTRHVKQELSRAPVFRFEEIEESLQFIKQIDEHYEAIKAAAESTTRHGKLIRIDKIPIHNRVILDFIYDTAEAAGQNMVTMSTDAACKYIVKNLSNGTPHRYLVESNFNADKNPAQRSLMKGRGHHVIASFRIPNRVLKKLLRVSADEIVEALVDKHLGSQMAGVLGMNLHVANALAALYLALGQDVACVSENAIGIATYEKRGDDLYATLSMPSLTVGTVGGATRLNAQRANMEMIGCAGGKNSSRKLAEIICASALALEISLAGAIVSNEFAEAHAKFGR